MLGENEVHSGQCHGEQRLAGCQRKLLRKLITREKVADSATHEIVIFWQLGGDGNIYIGRDWFYENSYGTKSLAIQFLGDFMRYELTEAQLDAMQSLLRAGIRENILAPDYKIYGLNQTKLSKYSPGVNAVRHLKKLQQFSWCGEAGNDACGRKDEISWNFNKEPR